MIHIYSQEIVNTIFHIAFRDARDAVPEYHPSNTGEGILDRLARAEVPRPSPRHGDARAARKIYSGARFFLRCQDNLGPDPFENSST